MIVEPNSNISQSLESLPQKMDRTMMRTAIIMERETKDLAPIAVLGIPAAALLTFYAKNDAFINQSTDKQVVRILKNVCNRTSDTIYNSSEKGVKAAFFSCWRGLKWLKAQARVTGQELKEIFSPQFKRLGNALLDDARSVLRHGIK